MTVPAAPITAPQTTTSPTTTLAPTLAAIANDVCARIEADSDQATTIKLDGIGKAKAIGATVNEFHDEVRATCPDLAPVPATVALQPRTRPTMTTGLPGREAADSAEDLIRSRRAEVLADLTAFGPPDIVSVDKLTFEHGDDTGSVTFTPGERPAPVEFNLDRVSVAVSTEWAGVERSGAVAWSIARYLSPSWREAGTAAGVQLEVFVGSYRFLADPAVMTAVADTALGMVEWLDAAYRPSGE